MQFYSSYNVAAAMLALQKFISPQYSAAEFLQNGYFFYSVVVVVLVIWGIFTVFSLSIHRKKKIREEIYDQKGNKFRDGFRPQKENKLIQIKEKLRSSLTGVWLYCTSSSLSDK